MKARTRGAVGVVLAVVLVLPLVSGCESKQQREENARLKGQVASLTQQKADMQKRVDEATQEHSRLQAKVDELTQKINEGEAKKAAAAKPAAKTPAKPAPRAAAKPAPTKKK